MAGIHPARFGSLVALLLPATGWAQSQVWVVDDAPGPGVDFTTIQAAVNAAADGDILLVRAGSYAGFTVAGRSLTLTADAGATVTVAGTVIVSGTSGGQSVTLRGFDVNAGLASPPVSSSLSLSSNPGRVWVEDCSFVGQPMATGCSALAFLRCAFQGSPGGLATHALSATNSSVHVYQSTFYGGPSGDGMHMSGGFLFASSSVFIGGSGYAGGLVCPGVGLCYCTSGLPGGHGLHLVGTSPVASHRACTFSGGPGGPSGPPTPPFICTAGSNGSAIKVDAGTATPIAGPGRSLVLTSPVRELQSVVLTFAGPPGDLLVLLFSPAYIPLFLPSCSGTLLPASPLAIFQGAVPASGVLTVTVPVPELGVGFEGAILFTQANFITPAGFCNVSSGSAVVLLDQAF